MKSALIRGILKRNIGRFMIHFTAESSSIELLFRTLLSVNQLSIHGAVSSSCEDLAQKIPGQTSMGVTKTHVYSDSVLCLGRMHDHSEANEKLKSQIQDFQQSN